MKNYFTPETDPAIDFDKVDKPTLSMLNQARDKAGIPFIITSHYRTPQHSMEVGGLPNDAHTEIPCTAFDISCTSGRELFAIVKAALDAGFKRVGLNHSHVHVDRSSKLPLNVLWVESDNH
ncbi:MAG TPA: D-Ala-D-Ala carboxypeptidase family metallohydrolase [Methylococcales bacterium]